MPVAPSALLRALHVSRRLLALGIVLVSAIALVSGWEGVCEQIVTADGEVLTTCHSPQINDAVVAGIGLSVLLLLGPDLVEFGVPGVISLKRQIAEQQSRLSVEEDRREVLEAQVSSLSATLAQVQVQRASADAVGVVVLDGSQTAQLAVGGGVQSLASEVDLVDQSRYAAAETLLRAVRHNPPPSLTGSELHLYLPDDSAQMLLPALEESAGGSRGWRVGEGLVGRAWEQREAVTARGAEISDVAKPSERQLAEADQSLPRQRSNGEDDGIVVAAVPILNAVGQPIGVFSATDTDPESQLDTPSGISELIALSGVIARVLVDLLGWATDNALLTGREIDLENNAGSDIS